MNKLHATVSKAATTQANNLRLSLPSDKIKADDDLEDDEDQQEPVADEYSQDSGTKETIISP